MKQINLIMGDITEVSADAIVNAANSGLLGGGGVDGAIHRAGGPSILAECREIGGCKTGDAVITTAGRLNVKKVIHTVGPVWRGGNNNEENLLRMCYSNSIRIALENGLYKIAFPNISTGVYRFPKKRAAEIAVDEVISQVKKHPELTIDFVCFDRENYNYYSELLDTEK